MKVNIQWIDWLEDKNIKIIFRNNYTSKLCDKECYNKTPIVNFLKNTMCYLNNLTDEREEWEKDKWDVRNLENHGITYNKSSAHYFLDFSRINNIEIRLVVKKYMKERLISNNNFSWSTAKWYLTVLILFINYICELNPTWNDFKQLDRSHILKYIEWLHIYCNKNLTKKMLFPINIYIQH